VILANATCQPFVQLCRAHPFAYSYLPQVERQGAPVFSSINAAMSCVSKVIKENVLIEELCLKDNAQPVKLAHIQVNTAK
jgi:hypothetical protein